MSVKPINDPCIGNLQTPINSSPFIKNFLRSMPAYRSGISPNLRGVEIGMVHGYFLYGPFAYLGPLRNTDYSTTAGLLASVSFICLLTAGLSLYGLTGNAKIQPSDGVIKDRPSDVFTKEGWSEFVSGFWLGGFGGAAFAWFLCTLGFAAPIDGLYPQGWLG